MEYFIVYYFVESKIGRFTAPYFTGGGYNEREAEGEIRKRIGDQDSKIQIDGFDPIDRDKFEAIAGPLSSLHK